MVVLDGVHIPISICADAYCTCKPGSAGQVAHKAHYCHCVIILINSPNAVWCCSVRY